METWHLGNQADIHKHDGVDDVPFVPEYERTRLLKEDLNPNYEGDWTNLEFRRYKHEDTRSKYINLKIRFPTTESRTTEYFFSRNGISLEKPSDVPLDKYEEMLKPEHYDNLVNGVFNSTNIGPSNEYGKLPKNLGTSQGKGDVGVVFTDLRNSLEVSLGNRQKNIIEAHEKSHGMFCDLTNGEKDFISKVFLTKKNIERGKIINGYKFKVQIDEVIARMSQLKNYFGFDWSQVFTKSHLDYARQHYISDTKLDNNMQDFFDAIDGENEDEFVVLMNTIAC